MPFITAVRTETFQGRNNFGFDMSRHQTVWFIFSLNQNPFQVTSACFVFGLFVFILTPQISIKNLHQILNWDFQEEREREKKLHTRG